MTGRSAEDYAALFENCSRMMFGLRSLPQPVIALVQGFATGAGCQLVSACDLALAAPEAAFATPGVKLGLFCSTPMVPLVRSIPPKFAMEMLLTGQPVAAERAAEIGLVNRVVPADKLVAEGMELARRIAAASGLTLAIGKRAFYQQGPLDERRAYEDASRTMTENALTRDAQEGMTAFLQKRAPNGAANDDGGKGRLMGLPTFDELFARMDARRPGIAVVAAGGADPTVLRALDEAARRGWVRRF